MEKSKIIRFRVNEPLYNYLKRLTNEMRKYDERWTLSEFIRMVLSYFLMAHMLGELKKPFWQIKKEFLDYAKTYYPPKEKDKK